MYRFRWPLIISAVILALTGRTPSLVDSSGGQLPAGVRLDLSPAYIATSPISRTLDALSLFSLPQISWFFGVIIAGTITVRLISLARSKKLGKRRVLLAASVPMMVCALTEIAVILLPRPMAGLFVPDPDVVRVDFHSHTRASHDANRFFSAERNRRWHAAAGFDVAYITDHVRWGGAIAARMHNPARAGDGTSLLSGVEGHYHKVSTIMLGFDASDSSKLTHWGELKGDFSNKQPQWVTIAALPANLDSVESAVEDTLQRFTGIELVDAAPRGLGQVDRQELRIRQIALSHHLIVVASSNNHGWGQTAAAWNLVRIAGWRDLPPDSVGRLIERLFRTGDGAAVTIVERNRTRLSGLKAPFTFPVTVIEVVGSLTLPERAAWVGWVWAIFLVYRAFHSVRGADSEDVEDQSDAAA